MLHAPQERPTAGLLVGGLRPIAVAASVVAGLAMSGGALAQDVNATTTADLSLRNGPSTDYRRILVIPEGAGVELIRCIPDRTWCQLDYDGTEGWSAAAYLELQRPDADQPIAQLEIDLPVPFFDFFDDIGITPPGRGDDDSDVARGEVCFYADFDYGGDSFCASRGEGDASLPDSWNDRISAVRTGPGTAVYVCEHDNYNGNCRRISGDVESFAANWNDVISSYEVGGRPGDGGGGGSDPDQVAANEVCFYQDFNYGGAERCVSANDTQPQLSGEWNDSFSSVRVGSNAALQICEDYGFDGNCVRLNSSDSQFSSGWNDTVSSYRVRVAGSGGGNGGGDGGDGDQAATEVCFYHDFNFGGAERCVTANETNAQLSGQWNDSISSIRVGSQAELQICEDYDFNGNCRRLNDDVTQLPQAWNDTISSYRVR